VLAGEDVRGYVIEHLGDPGAVLVDETGDLKKGTATVIWSRPCLRRA